MKVKIGQYAHVVISLGPKQATIPILTDHSIRAARIELLRSGMQVGEISQVYVPGSETDAVLQQDPAPGTSDVTSPHVDLLVSLGRSTRSVRDAGTGRLFARRSGIKIRGHRSEGREAHVRTSPRRPPRNCDRPNSVAWRPP